MLKEKKSLTRVVLIIMTCVLLLASGCANTKDNTDGSTTSQAKVTDTEKSAAPTDDATSKQEDVSPTEPEDTEEPTEPTGEISFSERIGFITQSYDGGNIIEIPYIEYDGDMNPEIDAINRMYNQGSQFSVDEFMNNKMDHEWIEIRSYPFTTDKYLQIVTTSCVYPNYGTDGDIESVNYDRIVKKWLTIEDALGKMGLSESDVSYGVGENYDPELYGGLIAELSIDGFLIRSTPDGEAIELLLSLTIENPEADQWQGFFSYMPDGNDLTNDLMQLNSICLFDPYDMDQMDPPLAYQQNNAQ